MGHWWVGIPRTWVRRHPCRAGEVRIAQGEVPRLAVDEAEVYEVLLNGLVRWFVFVGKPRFVLEATTQVGPGMSRCRDSCRDRRMPFDMTISSV